jgi:hypothetical protein
VLLDSISIFDKRPKEAAMWGERYYSRGIFVLVTGIVLGLVAPTFAELDIPDGWTSAEATLVVTDNLSASQKELIVETEEWKVIFSLFYNGGIYRLFDKVYDPNQTDNLATGPWYTQGGIFDYEVYLIGSQEFMTTVGKNNAVGRATLEILENTPVRLRLRQKCHLRLNNGQGPPGDSFIELDMVEATTDWTFYPTGRVNIKFDAVVPDDWDGIVSQGPGGSGKGINASGSTITATNGTNFLNPWVTQGDTIESSAGGWGPVEIASRVNQNTLSLVSSVGAGTNLDYTICRPYITGETISIHADGDPGSAPFTSYWQGGSDGDPLYDDGGYGDKFRNPTPPVEYDYTYVHWTRPPREYGSLLTFNETYPGANFAVFNDQCCTDISYTQVGRWGVRPFEEHHRHFMAHLGTENGLVLPRIKSVADALPLADDYKNPYAEARAGTLLSGEGISAYGYHVPSGAYHIAADTNNTAEIVFDAARGGSVASPVAYYQPAVLVSDFDVNDMQLNVELSQDNGATFEQLPGSWYNVTSKADSAELSAPGKRLIQLLCPIPTTATGANKWVLRVGVRGLDFIDFAAFAEQWFKTNCGSCEGADLTGDGNVNLSDLEEFVNNWLDDGA